MNIVYGACARALPTALPGLGPVMSCLRDAHPAEAGAGHSHVAGRLGLPSWRRMWYGAPYQPRRHVFVFPVDTHVLGITRFPPPLTALTRYAVSRLHRIDIGAGRGGAMTRCLRALVFLLDAM